MCVGRLIVSDFASPRTVAHQASVHGLLQARYWSEFLSPSPGDLPYTGIEPGCPALQADSLLSEPPGKPINVVININ